MHHLGTTDELVTMNKHLWVYINKKDRNLKVLKLSAEKYTNKECTCSDTGILCNTAMFQQHASCHNIKFQLLTVKINIVQNEKKVIIVKYRLLGNNYSYH